MDISGIANLSTALSQQRINQSAELMVLKKAMQVQETAAMTLISSVAQAPTTASSLPPHLGQNVNVVA